MSSRLHIVALAGLAAVSLASAPAHAMVDVTGLWSVNDGKAEIAISECGETLCGHLISAKKIETEPGVVDKKNHNPLLRLRKLKGLLVLTGFVGGPSEWKGGTIYNPDDGGTYSATIRLVNPDTLKVTGCIIRPLCKSAKLTRSSREPESGKPEDASAGGDSFSVAKRGD